MIGALEGLRLLWERRDLLLLATVGALALLLHSSCADTAKLRTALAAKPTVETKIETKVKVVRGPVQIVERIVETPGADRIIYRTITRAPETLETTKESDRAETPYSCAALAPRRRFAGVMLMPEGRYIYGVRAGYTIMDRIDAAVGWSFDGLARGPRADLSLRF